MKEQHATEVVESMIERIEYDLTNSDSTVTMVIAETNATFYTCSDYELHSATYDPATVTVTFDASMQLSGDQVDEMPFCGDALDIRFRGSLKETSSGWEIDELDVISCTTNF